MPRSESSDAKQLISLNISANEICHWADSNKLRINKSKAKVLTITRKCLASNINDELVVHSNLLSTPTCCRNTQTALVFYTQLHV